MSQPSQPRQGRQTQPATQPQGQLAAQVTAMQQVTLAGSAYSLPSPKEMADYALIVPEAPQIFFQMLQEQHQHRLESERIALAANIRSLDANIALANLNGWRAFVVLIVLIAGFTLTGIFTRNAYVGTGGIVASIASFILTYFYNSRQQERFARLQQQANTSR